MVNALSSWLFGNLQAIDYALYALGYRLVQVDSEHVRVSTGE
jgi:hypothetical protein